MKKGLSGHPFFCNANNGREACVLVFLRVPEIPGSIRRFRAVVYTIAGSPKRKFGRFGEKFGSRRGTRAREVAQIVTVPDQMPIRRFCFWASRDS
jgi:hypothetical protein